MKNCHCNPDRTDAATHLPNCPARAPGNIMPLTAVEVMPEKTYSDTEVVEMVNAAVGAAYGKGVKDALGAAHDVVDLRTYYALARKVRERTGVK